MLAAFKKEEELVSKDAQSTRCTNRKSKFWKAQGFEYT